MAAIVGGTPDGKLVVGPDLRVVEWNEQFPDLAGVPKELLRSADHGSLVASRRSRGPGRAPYVARSRGIGAGVVALGR